MFRAAQFHVYSSSFLRDSMSITFTESEPRGYPDVNVENLQMRLEMLNVSVFHQVDHGVLGILVWDRDSASKIDSAAADECCHRYLVRPKRCLFEKGYVLTGASDPNHIAGPGRPRCGPL